MTTMKEMKIMGIPAVLLSLGMLLAGCTASFLEYNSNPYGVTDEVLASGGVEEKLANDCGVLAAIVIPLQENLFQNAISLGCESLSGYMGQTQHEDFGCYNYNLGFIEYPFTDEQSLPRVINQYNSLTLDTNADRENVFFAWGTILKVAIMHRISDMYGPVPYDFTGTEAQKPYQTQEQAYRNMIEDLTWASETLAGATLSTSEKNAWTTHDDVYSGDTGKWVKFANSLKLRLAVRVSGQLPQEAETWAEEALQAGVIESNADNAMKPTADNPFYKMSRNWGDTRCGADIISYMNAFEDPRREAYFETTSRGGSELYVGLRSGVNLPSKETLAADGLYSLPKVEMDDPVVWMTAAEVAFLKAEGALKQWNMGGDAETFYNEGIALSMSMHGVEMGDYLSRTGTRGAFTDSKFPAFNDPVFSSSVTVRWSDSDEDHLGQIITQKYIAMFPYGSPEAWAEWRRTGYPNLLPAIDYNHDVTNIGRDASGADIHGYRRYPMPPVEYDVNGTYTNAIVAEDLGGNDSPNTDVWWARKDDK